MKRSPAHVLWWSRVDRQAVIEAVQALVREPKLLGLIGDDASGLAEAASLAQEELERLGRKCLRVSDLDVRLPTLKYRMLELLNELVPLRQPSAVPPTLLLASSALSNVRASLSNVLSSLSNPVSLIFDRLDSQECPRRNEVFELQELARVSNTPILFTGESRCEWHSLAHGASLVQLQSFDRADVRACMLSAPPLAAWNNARIDGVLDRIFGNSTRVSPLEVFTHLKVLTT